MVHFVGAGSGAVDLITVRGARLLKEADVIIYAGSLVNPELLQDRKENCLVYDSAKMTLEEVLAVIMQAEEQGQMTVRLHTGDPCLYGAIREQMDALDERNISYEMCPGVSSFCGAAAALNLEYTLPGISQSVVITRMEGRTPVPEKEKIASFAAHGASMVIFLSTGLLKELSRELIRGGYKETTPAAIVYKATWPDEKAVICQVGTLYETAKRENITKTALILVGEAVAQRGYQRSRLYDPGFAGSGAVDLITVRGARLLKEADVIIYAGSLVNPELLQDRKENCLVYDSAKMTLEEVLAVIMQAEEQGQMTVRLHTGDPCLYGAIREQMDALDERNISYEMCPGVSSFCGAAAALNLEYTLPGISQSVVITRMEGRTPVPEKEKIASFAAHGASMVIFLSTGLLKELSRELIRGGYKETTPAAIVYKATWPDEKAVICQVGTLYETAKRENITKTALILVGEAVAQRGYQRSRLYDPGFTTEFRQGTDTVPEAAE